MDDKTRPCPTCSSPVTANHFWKRDTPCRDPWHNGSVPAEPVAAGEVELTFAQQQEVTALLEQYRTNPSNSNKLRFQLFAYVDALLASTRQAAYQRGRVDEAKTCAEAKHHDPKAALAETEQAGYERAIDAVQEWAMDNILNLKTSEDDRNGADYTEQFVDSDSLFSFLADQRAQPPQTGLTQETQEKQ